MAKIVQKTYGEALFELAMEKDPRKLLEETGQLSEILAANPDFDKLMKHPGIPKQEKTTVMRQVFQDKLDETLLGFLDLLIAKERYKELPSILEYFTARMKEELKIGVAFVTTAVAINDGRKQEIEKRLLDTTGYETFEMHYAIDPELIGGMVIRIGDRVVDSSIRSKLDGLTKQLLQIQLG